MRAWKELEADFRALRAAGIDDGRLDHQFGASGEHWRVCGGVSLHQIRRFEAIARLGGAKLIDGRAATDVPEIAQEPDSLFRWYRALVHLSGAYQLHGSGLQKDEHGNDAGAIYLGLVRQVFESSATLCVKLESLATVPTARVEALCSVPRYEGPCGHWRSAVAELSKEEPHHARAVHEAVSAVEGLCRIILGDPSITLGKALQQFRRGKRVHAGIWLSIEGLWAFASDEPGVRHGASSAAPAVGVHEARFVVSACEAALTLLLAIDSGAA